MKEWILWNCVNYDDGLSFLKKQKYIFFFNGDFCEKKKCVGECNECEIEK